LKPIFYFKNEQTKSALRRFLYFVLGISINNQNKEDEKQPQICVFIAEDFNFPTSLITSIGYNNLLIVFGYNNIPLDNYINILDFSNLKKNLQGALHDRNNNFNALLYVKKINSRISYFFKGHGETSLLNSLNWTRYYLNNGPVLLRDGKLRWHEYSDVYLGPGLKYWHVFQNRFEKCKIYLQVTGFRDEVTKTNKLSSYFNKFAGLLQKADEESTKAIDSFEIDKNIDYLKQIDSIFTKIQDKLNQTNYDI